MTYNEAKKVANDNWDLLNPHMIASTPPHLILGSVIAPEGTAIPTLGGIYGKIKDEHIPNDDILLEQNLFGNNLIVFVVFQMDGNVWFQPIESYKVAPFGVIESGNES
jgi:hypothetical protein